MLHIQYAYKTNAAKYFKMKNVFQVIHNHLQHCLLVEWHTR
jgi:hypothetical protein